MKLPDVLARLLGYDVPKPDLERADRVLDRIDVIEVKAVPKRDLRELRRYEAVVRRR